LRVVTYSRVSTIGQETEGQSLANQERAFSRAVEGRGWIRVRSYREAASAGTIAGRAEFSRMITELSQTKPDAIVIDTLDRFTRNLRDGLNLLEQLRGHHVGLIPLDWERERPIDLDEDRDWSDVVEEFTAAERERRKIRKRVRRSFEGRRERGATTTNKAPFGVVKAGDHLRPDPERAWIVNETDQRVLRGESMGAIATWANALDPKAWKTRTGVMLAARNPAYVVAGVRTAETQAALETKLAEYSSRYGMTRRVHAHELTGVFACGICVDQGVPEADALMHGGRQNRRETLVCDRSPGRGRGHRFFVDKRYVYGAWRAYVAALVHDDGAVERWAREAAPAAERRTLERGLAKIDQSVAALRERRDRALDLLGDPSPAVSRQVRQLLEQIDADEGALHAAREATLGELAVLDRPKRDPAVLRVLLQQFSDVYDRVPTRDRNALARALVAAIGSHPIVRRLGTTRADFGVSVSWPAVEGLRPGEKEPRAARR
jgi:DNA invertase Pin-like site-specific DNA recombinase